MIDKEQIYAMMYWEHFRYAKELALIYPPEHPKRIKIEATVNELLIEWNNLKSNNH